MRSDHPGFVIFCLALASMPLRAEIPRTPQSQAELKALLAQRLNNVDPSQNTINLLSIQLPDAPKFQSGLEVLHRSDLAYFEAPGVGIGVVVPRLLPEKEFGPGRTSIVETIDLTTAPQSSELVEPNLRRTISIFKSVKGAMGRIVDIEVEPTHGEMTQATLHRPLSHLSEPVATMGSTLGQFVFAGRLKDRSLRMPHTYVLERERAPRGALSTTVVLPTFQNFGPMGDNYVLVIERHYAGHQNLDSVIASLVRRGDLVEWFESPHNVRDAYIDGHLARLESATLLVHRETLDRLSPRSPFRDLLHRATFCTQIIKGVSRRRPSL